MSLRQVKDKPNLIRDETTRAVINIDNNGFAEYVNQYERLKQQQELILNNAQEVKNLKEEMSEIKSLIQQIATKLQGKE